MTAGIKANFSVNEPSAPYQFDSTEGGLLIPRMTTAQRDAIVSPVASLLIYNTTTSAFNMYSGAAWVTLAAGGGGAPSDASFITQTPSGGLSAEQALSALATGLMQVTTATGVVSSVTTSAGLAALISDETGSGALVFATSPTLVTPVLGAAAATTLTTSGTVAFGGGALVANNVIDVTKAWGDFSGTVNAASLISTATITANNAGVLESLFNRAEINQNGFNLTDTLGVRAITNQARVVGASGTVTGLIAMLNTVTNTGAGTLTRAFGFRVAAPGNTGGGVFTNWIAINIDAPVTPTNKTFILLNTTTNAAGDWGIYSTSTFNNSIAGALGLGGNFTPTNVLSLSGQAARTVWMERQTTSNTAGNSLTVQAGGATAAATDKAGGALILAPGLGTGNAVPGLVRLLRDAASPTSGTGDHTQVDGLLVGGFKVLTNNSAITILNASAAAALVIGGVIRYSIAVFDGTDLQVETGFAVYSGVNKAGVFTVFITEVNSQQSVSAGSLTTTWAISGANPAAISVNANSSLTPSAGYPRISYNVENFAQQSIAAA